MAEGLQYKENLTLISGGYPGEGTGSNGLVQNWTDTAGDSGSSTVTYFYHDSATMTDANSTYVEINITDNWTATKDNRNYYHITVSTTINYIRRTKVGSPSPLSVYMFARHDAGGANIWTSGGCVDAANSGTNATNINMGTTTIDLAPGQSTNVHGTVYFRSNICGHNNAKPPSIYVDEFWLGVNFRNTLPPDYRPGKTWNGTDWLSHNREAGSYTSRNILNPDKLQSQPSKTQGGVTLTKNSDKSFTISGTGAQSGVFGSNWVDYTHAETMALLSGAGEYTLSTTATGPFYPALGVEVKSGSSTLTSAWTQSTTPAKVNITQAMIEDSGLYLRFSFYGMSGQTIKPATFFTQFEKGSQATEYVPYGTNYISTGAADIYTSSSSKNTMRTQDGGVGTNNPPYTRHNDDTWRNQRKIGIE